MTDVGLIYSKLLTIQNEIGAIEKNGKGPAQKGAFAYIKYEDILDRIHALLNRERVIIVPKLKFSKHEVISANNRQNIYSNVEATYEFISVDDGSSVIVASVGEGSDIGSDTATRKSATQALKIAFLHTFTIPNTDDGLLLDNEGHEPVSRETVSKPISKPGAKTPTKIDSGSLGDAQQAVKKLVTDHPESFATPSSYVSFGNKIHKGDLTWVNNADKVLKVRDEIVAAISHGEVIE